MLLLELERRQVVQAAVRPDSVEVKAPRFDDDLCLRARAEPLDAQALVAELCPAPNYVPLRRLIPHAIEQVRRGHSSPCLQAPEEREQRVIGSI